MIILSPKAKGPKQFFRGRETSGNGTGVGFWVLTSSLVISWIFAKSITNAANLGLKYGIVGGIAYGTYYLSFLFAGLIIYKMRTVGKFRSIHHFLESKFGKSALLIFSLLIAFRLFNEVWSNTMVIGSYFGTIGSWPYYIAIIIFTLLTLAYVLKGGLSSSLMTDSIQMVLFGILLFGILSVVIPNTKAGFTGILTSGSWTLEGGVDLMLVAIIQSLSYPFHDPVMTDRGFISDPRTMKRAFVAAVPIGFIAIVSFSFLGVYAGDLGLKGQAAVELSKLLGTGLMLALNFIMITSASSTLDSSFSSFSKLAVVDLKWLQANVSNGRMMMILLAIAGTIPIFFDPKILSATTISGTMVIGLAPIFVFWNKDSNAKSFHYSVFTGVIFGVLLAAGLFPTTWTLVETPYGSLLSANLFGTIACFVMYFIGSKIK